MSKRILFIAQIIKIVYVIMYCSQSMLHVLRNMLYCIIREVSLKKITYKQRIHRCLLSLSIEIIHRYR